MQFFASDFHLIFNVFRYFLQPVKGTPVYVLFPALPLHLSIAITVFLQGRPCCRRIYQDYLKYFFTFYLMRIFDLWNTAQMNKIRSLSIHVIGCGLFLVLPFLFSPDSEGKRFDIIFTNGHFQKDVIHYVLLIIFFYLNYYFLVTKFYLEKKYWIYALTVVACFFLIAFLPSLIIHDEGRPGPPQNAMPPPGHIPPPGGMHKGPPPMGNMFWSHINHNFFLFFAVFFFSLLLRIALQWRQAQKEKLDAELSYLKAQINPHFLFNTLNSIYSLAIDKSDNTAPAVAKLSGMMRYVITDTAKEFVPLEKEIAYIKSYIELQRIRFGETIHLFFDVNGSPGGKQIAPLLLIPFIENAFKYGVNAEENSTIRIHIFIDENKLNMEVQNNKVNVQMKHEDKTGTGIANTQSRLQLLYPARHFLKITDIEKEFLVSLTLII